MNSFCPTEVFLLDIIDECDLAMLQAQTKPAELSQR